MLPIVRPGVTGADRPAWPGVNRVELSRKLVKLNPAVVELYDTAVDHLQRGPGEMGRVVVIAHCVGEIANNLAEFVSDADGTRLPPRVDLYAPIRDLRRAWETAGLGFAKELVTQSGNDTADDFVDGIEDGRIDRRQFAPVPFPVLAAAQEVVDADRRDAAIARHREAVAVGRVDVDADVTARLWSSTLEFFANYANLSRAKARPAPLEQELNDRFTTFESIIHARLADFFETKSAIIDVLTLANQQITSADGGELSTEETL